MFDWIGDALDWVGDKLSSAGEAISEAVWDIMLEWIFDTVSYTHLTLPTTERV